ncbi:MAG: hypothetical protein LIP00_07155 [Parabacteroides sp.]|nr:hypothetical protein [Parabacteroides sp.]
MNVFTKLCTAAFGALLIACTAETREGGGENPDLSGGGQDVPRIEVMATFKNQLSVGNTATKSADNGEAVTKAATPIATAVENKISSLDIYAFGSTTEDGVYTFQERFSYREDKNTLPAGATELDLESLEGDGSKTTALLSLKKGLFVKLYCIANQAELVDPADETNFVSDADFIPLELVEPGKAGSAIKTAGTPELTAFETFHTPLIDPAADKDMLACPLPMSGYAGQVLDLTDYGVTTRQQTSFKLTRLVARFDISNNSDLSHFTIESISMNNGRKGAGFFPIKVYGTLPDAAAGDLVTYPVRTFHGEKANKGIQTSAFYCYPSVLSDEAYLILNGKYQVNKTESMDVSYPIRFAPKGGETGTYLEVNHNHRYTIAITGADPEHLDFVLNVSDWSDSGAIDDYNPENKPDEVTITVPGAFNSDTQWNRDAGTVSMSLKDGSNFTVATGSNSALILSKTYAGKNQTYDWLEISEPTIAPATRALTAFGYTYTLSLKAGYTAGRYPKATVRFIDSASGQENVLFVEAIAAPQVVEIPKVSGDTNPNDFDAETLTASVYRITDSEVKIKFLCPDGVEVESKPDWLTVNTEENGIETIFTVVLNDRDITDATGTIVFHNKKQNTLKTDVTVNLQDASVAPSFNALGGTGTVYTPAATPTDLADVKVPVTSSNQFSVQTTSMEGVKVAIDFDGGSEWLSHDGETYTPVSAASLNAAGKENVETMSLRAGDKTTNITFSLVSSKLAGGKKATVTFKNNIGGADYSFTVTPEFKGVTVAKEGASVPTDDKLANTTLTVYKLPFKASTMGIKVTSYGGSKLEYTGTGLILSATENTANEAVYTLTATGAGTGTLKVMNYTDNTQFTEYTVNVIQTDLKVANTSVNLNAAANQTATNKITACPFGYTASVTSWGTGGAAWFDITTTNPSTTTGEQNIGFKVKSGLANTVVIKEATITLTNKMTDGGNITFTVKPVFQAPTLNLTSSYVVKGNSMQLTGTVYGGVTATSSNTSLATVTVGSDKKTVTVNGVGPGSVTITVKNLGDETKTSTFALTVKDVVLPAINGVRWAAGNLVMVNSTSCKIGNPGDYGVHFRFGSLVGYDSKDNTTNPKPVVKPSQYSGNPNFLDAPYATGDITQNASGGLGDPCKHYLGGTWRLPTADEYRNSLGGGVTGTNTFTDWKWVTDFKDENGNNVKGVYLRNSSDKVFFPASGYRDNSTGKLFYSGMNGYGWTSTPDGSSNAWRLNFGSSNVLMYNNNICGNGLPVRCVKK